MAACKKLDIVDTQVHIGPGRIEETLGAMDALGIQSILIDEYWLKNVFAYDPHHKLESGEIRPVCPTAELAAQLHPDRFSWVLRVNKNDPEYEAVIRLAAQSPFGRAMRIIPGMNPADRQAFAAGAYDHILEAAQRYHMPVCIYLPEAPDQIAACAQQFPGLKLIVDHCGLYSNAIRKGLTGGLTFTQEQQLAMFDHVLEVLAPCKNVALKWAHSSSLFEVPAFPGNKLWPLLRKAIDALGADRILWASDFSVNQSGENWGELLYSMKCNTELSEDEQAAVLGGNARNWFTWPQG